MTRTQQSLFEAIFLLACGVLVTALNGDSPLNIQSIQPHPTKLDLKVGGPAETVVLSATDSRGLLHDVTQQATFIENDHLHLDPSGKLHGIEAGEGTLSGSMGDQSFAIPYVVHPASDPAPLSFVKDILPILSRAGCNGGSCHAKPNGQNSFALSVFAYDPRSDYEEIVFDARGRRIFPGIPEQSLLLQKPTLAIPHKGGKRLEVGSDFHTEITRWISEGLIFQTPNEANIDSVRVLPPEGRFAPDSSHQLRVEAQYENGEIRDITDMVDYAVSDKEMITVTESGRAHFGNLSGQAVILARYMGHIGQLKVTIPATQKLGNPISVVFKERNFIDRYAAQHFANLGLTPSEPCRDHEFLRRAFLDGVGRLPTIEETRSFLADEGTDRRRRWIETILDDPLYGHYWANKWADLLRPNPDRVGVKSVFVFDRWLREQFQTNTPYDQFVRNIVSHRGSNHGEGPAVIYRDRRIPTELSSMFSQLFLGVRMECAKCHHHPFEKWSQDDFYQFAAYFGSLKQKGAGLSPPISAGTEIFYFAPGGSVKHPITDQAMKPKAPDGPLDPGGKAQDPRQRLADWLTEPSNPYFTRAIVNRVWANFFSRGFVNPVDDFRDSNPPVNEALLTALAEDFAAQGFDLKQLMETIMNSSLYQLSAIPNDSNLRDTKNFSRFYRKRLPAETLLDAVCDVTGVPESFDGMPPGSRAIETWTYKIGSQFLDAFSRPNSSSDPPCERDEKSSVVQALHLMNSDNIQSKLSAPDGWISKLVKGGHTNAEIVEQFYLASFSRFPTDEERSIAEAAIPDNPDKRQAGIEDLLWALINTAEFVFNH